MMTSAKPLDNPQNRRAVAVIGGGAGAIAVLAAALIAPWEGKRNDPYLDIVKVPTVCYGETRVPMRRYSDAECSAMLQKAVGKDFVPAVLNCTPGLRDPKRINQAVAATMLAYNIGAAGYCRSTAARKFNAGDFVGGCRAFAGWVKAKGRVVQGLVNRRNDEMRICLKGL